MRERLDGERMSMTAVDVRECDVVQAKPKARVPKCIRLQEVISRLGLLKHSANTYPFSSCFHYEPSSGGVVSVSLFQHIEHGLDVPAQLPPVSTADILYSRHKAMRKLE
jgi:hypothetical protein